MPISWIWNSVAVLYVAMNVFAHIFQQTSNKDDSLPAYCTVYSRRSWLILERCLLPPSLGWWWWRQYAPLRWLSFYMILHGAISQKTHLHTHCHKNLRSHRCQVILLLSAIWKHSSTCAQIRWCSCCFICMLWQSVMSACVSACNNSALDENILIKFCIYSPYKNLLITLNFG
jgi:hypothetical protein